MSNTSMLCFVLNKRRFALPLDSIIRVIRSVAVVAIPNSHQMIQGVFDFHGEIVPAINMRVRFGLPTKAIEISDQFIMIRLHSKTIALVVDEVAAVDVSIDQEINEVDVPIISSNENNSMDADVSSMQFLSDKNGIIVIYDIEKIIDSSIALHIQDVLEKS